VELALKLEPLIAAQAKESYAKHVGRPRKSPKNSAEIITPEEAAVTDAIVDKLMAAGKRETRNRLAKVAGVSHDTIAKGKLIDKHARFDYRLGPLQCRCTHANGSGYLADRFARFVQIRQLCHF
jgi:hypothetical protein